jgi:anti-anti-sigma factor
MELAVVTREESGIPVLEFSGDLDGILVDEFERAVIETAQDADDCVIVDLGAVTYIDSQGFGRLLRAHVILESRHGDLAIVASGSNVSRIIETFGSDYLLAVFGTVQGAVDFLLPLIELRKNGDVDYPALPKHSS